MLDDINKDLLVKDLLRRDEQEEFAKHFSEHLFFSQSKYDTVVLQPLLSVATKQVWAIPRSLATTRGIIIYFLQYLQFYLQLEFHTFEQLNCP